MDRYVFYNERTGEIVHSHQSLRIGSSDLMEPDAETIALLTDRVAAFGPVARVTTNEPLVSSLRAARRVDVRTGRLEIVEADPRFRVRATARGDGDLPDDEQGA